MSKRVIILAVGLLIAGVSVWYIFNGGQSDSNNQASNNETKQSPESSTEIEKDSLLDVVKSQKNAKIFNDLINQSGLLSSFQDQGPYTVLVPTDDAFKELPEGFLDTLKKSENKSILVEIINYHIIKGNLVANSLQNGQKLPTVNGQEMIIEVSDGKAVFISAKGDKAMIKTADLNASNGIVHVVSTVLLPQ